MTRFQDFSSRTAEIRKAIRVSRNKHFAWWLGNQTNTPPKDLKKLIDAVSAADAVETGDDDLIAFSLRYSDRLGQNLLKEQIISALDTALGAAEIEIVPNRT